VRFDSSALSPDDAFATPMAAARASLVLNCASLQPEIATLLTTLGKEHLLLMQKTLHKSSQIEKLNEDEELIPRSARIKFHLSTMKAAETDPGYIGLKAETETLVIAFQKALKTKVVAVAELEVKLLRSEIQKYLASNLYVATKALLICDNLAIDPHKIVNTILEQYATPLLASFHITVADFRALYSLEHTVMPLPPPIDGPVQTPVGQDVAVIPSLALQAFAKIYRVIESTFVSPWNAYLDTQKRLAITVALKTLRVEHFEPAATEAANMIIDDETAADPPQLRAIVDAQVSSKTASLRKEVSALRVAMSKLKPLTGGPSTGAPAKKEKKKKKKNATAEAAAPGNDSTKGAADKTKQKKPSPTQRSKRKSNSKRSKPATP
jgi:hypothetical protein